MRCKVGEEFVSVVVARGEIFDAESEAGSEGVTDIKPPAPNIHSSETDSSEQVQHWQVSVYTLGHMIQ